MLIHTENNNEFNDGFLWGNSHLSDEQVSHYLRFAQNIALEAGTILRTGFYRNIEVSKKSDRELVTSIDVASEKLLRKKIFSEFPDHKILSEELGDKQDIDVPDLWVIDPLDGTNNFAHGFPVFAVSIAFIHRGILEVGVVHDPMRNEIFVASSRTDAYLNGAKITVSRTEDISQSLIATGFPYHRSPGTENNLDYFISFWYAAQGIRRAGSAALDICYTAAGRLDGFWELKLKPWDMSAGALIAKKAGAVVTDFDGNPWQLQSDRIVVANPKIHRQMLDIIKGNGK